MTAPCLSLTGTKKQVCGYAEQPLSPPCSSALAFLVAVAAHTGPSVWALDGFSGLEMMHAVKRGPCNILESAVLQWGLGSSSWGRQQFRCCLGAACDLLLSHSCRQEILPGGDPDEQHGTR